MKVSDKLQFLESHDKLKLIGHLADALILIFSEP
jgi:hypothetical protein